MRTFYFPYPPTRSRLCVCWPQTNLITHKIPTRTHCAHTIFPIYISHSNLTLPRSLWWYTWNRNLWKVNSSRCWHDEGKMSVSSNATYIFLYDLINRILHPSINVCQQQLHDLIPLSRREKRNGRFAPKHHKKYNIFYPYSNTNREFSHKASIAVLHAQQHIYQAVHLSLHFSHSEF